MTAPHAAALAIVTHAIADKLRRQWRSDRLQHKIMLHSLDFIHEAFRLWRFDHEELWREQGAESFDAWVNKPANRQHSPSRAHLQVQIIETCWYHFGIDRALLYPVGYRKFQIIMPEIVHIRETIAEDGLARRGALGWVFAAHTNTVPQLETLMVEQSTRYAGKNASIPPVGGQTGQFEALIERQPFDIVWLRASKDVDELLARLGLSDITGGQIYLSAFRPRPKD